MPRIFGQKIIVIISGAIALAGLVGYNISGVSAQGLSDYLHFPGTSIPGHNITSISGQTPSSCARACDANSRCISFDIDRSGTCYLQDADRRSAEITNSDTYDYYERRRATSGSVAGYQCFDGKTIPGRNIQTLSGQTRASCAAACDGNNRCKSFDIDAQGNCWLQDADRSDVELSNSGTYDYCERPMQAVTSVPKQVSAIGEQVAEIWNSAGCGYTDSSPLQLASLTTINRLDLWYNWASGESSTGYEILAPDGSVVHRGTLERKSCDPYQQSWCVAGDTPGVTLPRGNYRVRVPRERVCQNSASNGRGFIQAWGDSGGSSVSRPAANTASGAPARSSAPSATPRIPSPSRSSLAPSEATPAGLNGFVCVLDVSIPGRNIRSLSGQTYRSCAIACRNQAGCKSFDIDRGGTCYLQDADSDDVKPVRSTDYDFCQALSG